MSETEAVFIKNIVIISSFHCSTVYVLLLLFLSFTATQFFFLLILKMPQ